MHDDAVTFSFSAVRTTTKSMPSVARVRAHGFDAVAGTADV